MTREDKDFLLTLIIASGLGFLCLLALNKWVLPSYWKEQYVIEKEHRGIWSCEEYIFEEFCKE